MTKLNNKGFAISVMMYGLITLIIIILTLLLSIMRSSYNKKNIATEQISENLNACIDDQIDLQKCYIDNGDSSICENEYKRYAICINGLSN